MRRWMSLPLLLLLILAACARGQPTPEASPLSLKSPAFAYGSPIPVRYTCDGEDVSPPLQWSSAPEGVKSFALLVTDPDAPMGTFVHWVLYNIPASRTDVPEGVPPKPSVPGIGVQGVNDFGPDVVGYRGPCPPRGKPHRYFFTLYALDTELPLGPKAQAREVKEALRGHVIGRGEWMGTYQRE